MDKDDVTLSHLITTIYSKNTAALQPHVGCLKRLRKKRMFFKQSALVKIHILGILAL